MPNESRPGYENIRIHKRTTFNASVSPLRRKSSRFGILNEPSPVAFEIKTPKKSSCFYLLQVTRMGDYCHAIVNLAMGLFGTGRNGD